MTQSSRKRAAQPRVHPSGDRMADFAAGQLHPYRRWIVESHLHYCSTCRSLAAQAARVGGAWFDSLAAQAPAEASPDSDVAEGRGPTAAPDVWSQLEAKLLVEVSLGRQPVWPEIPLPESVRREIEATASSPEWIPVGESSSRVVRVALDPQEELEFFLVRTPAGGCFPRHRHVHGEDLLVLTGSLRDDYGSLRAGDLRHYPAGTSHAPEIGAEEECFGISCVQGGLVFEA